MSQSNTARARRAVIQLGNISLEVFLLEDGQYRLSQTQIAEAVGKGELSVRQFWKSASPEALPYKDLVLDKVLIEKDHKGRGLPKISAIPPALAMAYWIYQARKGNPRDRLILESIVQNTVAPFQEYAGTYLIYPKPKDKALQSRCSGPIKHLEDWYVNKLKKKLGGETEVFTPAGLIDLLTAEQLIEVKEVKRWKCAIGQVETYGDYYPSHQKRIHLFGPCHESFYAIIEFHCTKRKIILTWES
ncbi:hypothetical protein [Kamptonema formosum]|uniref:hypothetical protein n=1 Tax=Kamptonema formosum TaxID=331992 RepID=UPI00036DC0B9|nr:hypothetical protein [Oscillatoria sp. PCC 10802]